MSNDLVIYKGSRRFVDDVISDIEKRVDALEGDGEKRKAMSNAREDEVEPVEFALLHWSMDELRAGRNATGETNRGFRAGWQAARQSAGATGQEPVAWVWCDTIYSEHTCLSDAEAIEEGWIPLVYGSAAPIGDNGAELTDRAMACFREALVERIWSVTAGEISEILQRARALLARASAKGE